MSPFGDPSDEEYWLSVGTDREIHPYGMHKKVNRDDVEVVHCVSDDRSPRRWVLVTNGQHEAWVMRKFLGEYGYDVRPDERVSNDELEAITLKQNAVKDGESVSIHEAKALLDDAEPPQFNHALVALYYAAKADPSITDEDVDEIRELMHEHTGHVDTNHKPTVKRILDEHLSNE